MSATFVAAYPEANWEALVLLTLARCRHCREISQETWLLIVYVLVKNVARSAKTISFIVKLFREEGRDSSCFLTNNFAGSTRFCREKYLFTISIFVKFAFGFMRCWSSFEILSRNILLLREACLLIPDILSWTCSRPFL